MCAFFTLNVSIVPGQRGYAHVYKAFFLLFTGIIYWKIRRVLNNAKLHGDNAKDTIAVAKMSDS